MRFYMNKIHPFYTGIVSFSHTRRGELVGLDK